MFTISEIFLKYLRSLNGETGCSIFANKDIYELDTNKKSLKAESLLANLCSEQNFFKLPGNESVSTTRVIFEILKKIAALGKSLRRESLLKNACHVQFL